LELHASITSSVTKAGSIQINENVWLLPLKDRKRTAIRLHYNLVTFDGIPQFREISIFRWFEASNSPTDCPIKQFVVYRTEGHNSRVALE
jgi:hypothetical protein